MLNFSSRLYISILITAGLSGTNIALASETLPSSTRSISEQHLQKLEKMHGDAEHFILKNQLRAALRVYEDIVMEEPDDEVAYTGLAQCHMVLGQFERAKEAYQNALHINPGNPTALSGLQKIANPDSLNFTEGPRPSEVKIEPAAPPAVVESKKSDIYLGAKKTMAPYTLDTPAPIREFSHEQLIQAALKNAGFYGGSIDGVVGNSTHRAIKEFQAAHDLRPDGLVGPKTWAVLQPYLNKNSFD